MLHLKTLLVIIIIIIIINIIISILKEDDVVSITANFPFSMLMNTDID